MNYKCLIIIIFCINIGYLVKDDGLQNKTCIDHDCHAFVQVSRSIGIGGRLEPISIYNGQQYEIELLIFKVHMQNFHYSYISFLL
jgi:hypothetical protein